MVVILDRFLGSDLASVILREYRSMFHKEQFSLSKLIKQSGVEVVVKKLLRSLGLFGGLWLFFG